MKGSARAFVALCATAAAVGGAGTAKAADSKSKSTLSLINQASANKDIFSFDYGVPNSPAAALVGTKNDAASGNPSMKAFVFSLPSDWGGEKKADVFSLDFSPFWLLAPDTDTNYDAISRFRKRGGFLASALTHFRLDSAFFIGTNAGGDASKQVNSRVGVGGSVSLLDASDPTLTPLKGSREPFWIQCIDDVKKTPETVKYQADWAAQVETLDLAITGFLGTIPLVRNPGAPGRAEQLNALNQGIADCQRNQTLKNCAELDKKGGLAAYLKSSAHPDQGALDNLAATLGAMKEALAGKNQKLFAKVAPQVANCVKAASTAASYAPALTIGGGVFWTGQPGKVKGYKNPAEVLWLSGRYPLIPLITGRTPIASASNDGNPAEDDSGGKKNILNYMMLGGSVRRGWGETVATGDKTTPQMQADTLDAWIGLERYTGVSKFGAQIGYQKIDAQLPSLSSFSNSGTRWLLSASFKMFNLTDGSFFTGAPDSNPNSPFWLGLSYGHANGTTTKRDDKTFMLTISFSPPDADNLFGEKPPASSGDD